MTSHTERLRGIRPPACFCLQRQEKASHSGGHLPPRSVRTPPSSALVPPLLVSLVLFPPPAAHVGAAMLSLERDSQYGRVDGGDGLDSETDDSTFGFRRAFDAEPPAVRLLTKVFIRAMPILATLSWFGTLLTVRLLSGLSGESHLSRRPSSSVAAERGPADSSFYSCSSSVCGPSRTTAYVTFPRAAPSPPSHPSVPNTAPPSSSGPSRPPSSTP